MKPIFLLLALAIPVAIGRFLIPGHSLSLAGTYEAFAHFWVMGMIIWAVQRWSFVDGKLAALLLLLLSVLEVVMFVMFLMRAG